MVKECDRSCKHWAYDMDGAYCAHPTSFAIAPTWGASTNRMSTEGHCVGGHGPQPDDKLQLWETADNATVS